MVRALGHAKFANRLLCARELKLTLSVGSLGFHLRACATWIRFAGSAKDFAGKVEGTVGDIAVDAKT
jgi:hypothetical protein